MKIIHKNQAEIHENSDVCSAIEYPSDDKGINGAVVKLNGRYPDKDRVVNLKCKEMVYIIKGSGNVIVEGKKIELTSTEFRILQLLASRKGLVFTRDNILDYLWGQEKAVIDRTVDVHIRHLREKLGKAAHFIKNLRGIGYKLEE